jgi:hypothetical protein
MILAVTGIVHAFDLLPYYLDHYRKLGVERFVIACDPDQGGGELGRLLSTQRDVEALPMPRTFRRSSLVGMIEEETRLRIADPDDWVVPADLDELNQYPDELRDLVRTMQRHGYTHVTGELRDRLAAGGELTSLLPFSRGIPIWQQYPLEGSVTSELAHGSVEKVLLSRGDLGWTVGHHRMRPRPTLMPYPRTGTAYHFKWREGLAGNLAWRVQHESRARVPWCKESLRLDEHLRNHGRINLDEIETTTGWQPK